MPLLLSCREQGDRKYLSVAFWDHSLLHQFFFFKSCLFSYIMFFFLQNMRGVCGRRDFLLGSQGSSKSAGFEGVFATCQSLHLIAATLELWKFFEEGTDKLITFSISTVLWALSVFFPLIFFRVEVIHKIMKGFSVFFSGRGSRERKKSIKVCPKNCKQEHRKL